MGKRGLFIVFEGIDGAGKSSQMGFIGRRIQEINRYQDVLITREPTWRAEEIKSRLAKDKSAFDGGENLANLFIDDRRVHTYEQIIPELKLGTVVLCDRYSLSTCVYQSFQGVALEKLLKMHEYAKTIMPDITFFIDVSERTAERRKINREQKPEKFEKDIKFTEMLSEKYGEISRLSWSNEGVRRITGKVDIIDGEQTFQGVARQIGDILIPAYRRWMKT